MGHRSKDSLGNSQLIVKRFMPSPQVPEGVVVWPITGSSRFICFDFSNASRLTPLKEMQSTGSEGGSM
jgi:hypothetical protein